LIPFRDVLVNNIEQFQPLGDLPHRHGSTVKESEGLGFWGGRRGDGFEDILNPAKVFLPDDARAAVDAGTFDRVIIEPPFFPFFNIFLINRLNVL
jgi:hypothetical protein